MAKKIQWMYHRSGCTSCTRAQEFLADADLEPKEIVKASKKLGRDDALAIAADSSKLFAAKGKKLTKVDLKKDKPDDDTLASLMLGPTGNLRAPTMRVGKTVVVGFNAEVYEEVLK